MFGALDISTSGLVAQRTRLDVISSNLANQHTVFDADGKYAPFRRKIAVLSSGDSADGQGMGVHVSEIMEDTSPFKKVHVGVDHPLADEEGYMNVPNIEPTIELVNALEASRAYEANITAAETTKAMFNQALRLIA